MQRVTYDKVTYDPGKKDEQIKFLEKAKEDLEKEKAWVPSRSERIVKAIGLTTDVINDSKELKAAEEGYWKDKDYYKQVEEDLKGVVGKFTIIDENVKALGELIPQLKTKDVSKEVNVALANVGDAINALPTKWGVTGKSAGFNSLKNDIELYLKLTPWKKEEFEKAKATLDDRVKELNEKEQQQKSLEKAEGRERTTKKKESDQIKTKLEKIVSKTTDMDEAIKKLKLISQNIAESLRDSSVEQYLRGMNSHTSKRSTMTNKKLYLGEIATTRELTKKGEKARGVLWASPWSPGVNIAFLEGGAKAGSVYKLKTKVPDNLKGFLAQGKATEFKQAVKDKSDKSYWPFWHDVDKRFTTFTDELTYLMDKGYRLHEFKRKDKSTQQIMVAPGQLDAVTKAYEGR